jgi:hypothetical protein
MPSKSATAKSVVRPLSASKRKSLATEQLLTAVSATDKDAALTAALEIINEWLSWDREMGRRLHEHYIELEALNSNKKKPPSGPAPIPVSGPDLDHFNPYAKPDPYKLLDWYGQDAFRAAIDGTSTQTLRDLVEAVQAREPGTKPASRSRKQDMIDYIVEHVAGPGF